jgi:hypothetical protein
MVSIKLTTLGCVSLLLLTLAAFAQEPEALPDKPEPVTTVQPATTFPAGKVKRTADKEFILEATGLWTSWLTDSASTKHVFDSCQSCVETGGFFNGTRATEKIVVALALEDAAIMTTAYLWKRYVRNKYLHPLWRGFMLFQTANHFHAVRSNYRILHDSLEDGSSGFLLPTPQAR